MAVKVIRVLQPKNILDLTERYDELLQEIKVWGRLQNEHILPVLGYVYGHGHLPSLVFPWMENGSLTNFLREYESLVRGERFRLVSSFDYDGIHAQMNFCMFSCKISPRHCNIVCLHSFTKVWTLEWIFYSSACYRSGSRGSNRCESLPNLTGQTSTDDL